MAETTVQAAVEEATKRETAGEGRVVRVIGPVVDVKFDGQVPSIYNALTVEADTPMGHLSTVLEVESQLPGGVVRTGFLQGIYGTGAILVIVFIVRSLPVGTRSGISALRQIDKSIEESAYDLGANSGKVFMSVTLPLIKDSFFSGIVTTFVRSITAISAIILVLTPLSLLIPCRINVLSEKGAYGVSCAYATILIAIVYAAILLMNLFIRYFGTSRKIREAEKDA